MGKIKAGELAVLRSTVGALLGFSPREVVLFVGNMDNGRSQPLKVRSLTTGIHGYTREENLEEYAPKFNAGDIIAGAPVDRYGVTNEDMTRAEVIDVDRGGIQIKVLEGKPGSDTEKYVDYTFHVAPKYFVLVEAAKQEEEAEETYKVGDIVYGSRESGCYSKDKHFKLTGVNYEGAYFYEGVNFTEPYGDWIYDYQIGGKVEQEDDDFEDDDEETPVAEDTPKKRYIRMIGSDIGYNDGDVLELTEDGEYFIDNDGDDRPCDYHEFEELGENVAIIEKPVNREAVVEYMSGLCTEAMLDIVNDARK